MNEEEKQAIAYLKFYIERDVMYEDTHYTQIRILLNLIEKQQKEIKRLKENNKKLDRDIQILFTYFISKDEVREKAEDILSVFPDFDARAIELRKRFEELLGE